MEIIMWGSSLFEHCSNLLLFAYRQNHVGHIAFLSDDLKSRDSFGVTYDFSNLGGSILFDLHRIEGLKIINLASGRARWQRP